jgi:hypothetical protein
MGHFGTESVVCPRSFIFIALLLPEELTFCPAVWAGRTAGPVWRARAHPHRINRCQFHNRLEGPLPHRGCGIPIRCPQDPWNPSHHRIPNAEAGTAQARSLKFQISLVRISALEPRSRHVQSSERCNSSRGQPIESGSDLPRRSSEGRVAAACTTGSWEAIILQQKVSRQSRKFR